MTPALFAACRTAVHVVKSDGTVLRAGRACLFVLEQTGMPAVLARTLARPPLVWAVEFGYRVVAANRPFFARFLFRGTDE